MTKPVRVISIFFLTTAFLFSFAQESFAKSVTFGDLLGNSSSPLPTQEQVLGTQTDRARDLLSRIDEIVNKSTSDITGDTSLSTRLLANEQLAPSLSRGQDPQININERPTPIPPPPFINNNPFDYTQGKQLAMSNYQLSTINCQLLILLAI